MSSRLATRCKQAGGVSSGPCLPLPFCRNGKATRCFINDTDGKISLLGCAKLPARSQVRTEIRDCPCCCSGSLPTVSHIFLFIFLNIFFFFPPIFFPFFPLLFPFLPPPPPPSSFFYFILFSFSFLPFFPSRQVLHSLGRGPAQYLPSIPNTSGDPRGFSCLNQCLRMGWTFSSWEQDGISPSTPWGKSWPIPGMGPEAGETEGCGEIKNKSRGWCRVDFQFWACDIFCRLGFAP